MDEPREMLEAKELEAVRLEAVKDLAAVFGVPVDVIGKRVVIDPKTRMVSVILPDSREPEVIPPAPPKRRTLPREPIIFKRPKLLKVGRR